MSKARIAVLATVLIAAPFVAVQEGVVLTSYADPVGIDTACVGETDEEVVGFKKLFSRDECIAVMGASLYAHAMQLEPCVKRDIPRHQAAAILSLSYNIGVNAFCKSTLARLLNSGAPASQWCQEFDKWVFAKGIRLRGLVSRRAAEKSMCLTGSWSSTP